MFFAKMSQLAYFMRMKFFLGQNYFKGICVFVTSSL